MDKQQKLKIALPILVVVMGFVWGPIIFGGDSKDKSNNAGKSSQAKPGEQSPHSVAVRKLAHSIGPLTQPRARTSYMDWGRNPFMPGFDSEDLNLEGIVWDEDKPKAIISGNILSVGDMIGKSIVIDISPTSVLIRRRDGDLKLEL